MTDAQTWTLIGGFLAIMVAMSGLVLRIVKTEIAAGLSPVATEVARLGVKVDHLDRDVQTVVNQLMGDGPTPT